MERGVKDTIEAINNYIVLSSIHGIDNPKAIKTIEATLMEDMPDLLSENAELRKRVSHLEGEAMSMAGELTEKDIEVSWYQMKNTELQKKIGDLERVLGKLVDEIDVWNEDMQKVIGRQLDYFWKTLEDARALLPEKGTPSKGTDRSSSV